MRKQAKIGTTAKPTAKTGKRKAFRATAQTRFQTQLYTLRAGRGESLSELAEAVDSSKNYLWQLETRPDPDPGFKLLVKLRDHFGVSMSELIGEESPEHPPWRTSVFVALDRMPAPKRDVVVEMVLGASNAPRESIPQVTSASRQEQGSQRRIAPTEV